MGGAEAFGIALSENSSLTILDLGQNEIGDEGTIALADGIRKNIGLKELLLYSNKLLDEGAMQLGMCLKVNTVLSKLDISGNQIGDHGATSLVKGLQKNSSLKEIVCNCNKFDEKVVAELRNTVGSRRKKEATLFLGDAFSLIADNAQRLTSLPIHAHSHPLGHSPKGAAI